VARSLNAALGLQESFWAPSSYSAVALITPADVVAKAAYVLANPVAAGLVRSGRDWPGLWSAPDHVGGQPQEFIRPAHFFRPDGDLPEQATLKLVPPPGFTSAGAFRQAVIAALEAQEAAARDARVSAGLGFLGTLRVLAQRPTSRPASLQHRRGLNPRVACRDKWRRIEALGRLVAFLKAYRSALRAWRAGAMGVVFPAGTYLARVTHGVACAAPG
jgi:putative transposase